MDVDSSAIVMRDLDGDGVQDPVALVWYQEKGYTGLNGRLAIKHNGDNQTGVRVILSWYCCCDHCGSSSFTDFCRGAAVAITAFAIEVGRTASAPGRQSACWSETRGRAHRRGVWRGGGGGCVLCVLRSSSVVSPGGWQAGKGDDETIECDLALIPPEIERCVTRDSNSTYHPSCFV